MTQTPDVDRLVRSMLQLHGDHDDDHPVTDGASTGSWSKAPDFAADPERAAAVHAATQRDRERYLNAGLTPVDCRFCHVTVAVKKLGPGRRGQETRSRTHCGAMEFGGHRAVRDVRRGARLRG